MLRAASAFSVASCLLALSVPAATPANANGYLYQSHPTVIYPGPSYSYSYPQSRSYRSYDHAPRYRHVDRPVYHGRAYDRGYDWAPPPRRRAYIDYGPPPRYESYGYRYPRTYGYRSHGRGAYGAVRGGALLQTGGYPNCGSVAYIPYGWTWYRGRDYRC